ncbi:MAG: hypothetical protein AAGF56_13005 [Pseudomonadota bacterium]
MMLKQMSLIILLPLGLAACSAPRGTTGHEVGCVAGTLAGVAIGGAIGDQFGGGRGNAILTGAGAIAGGATAANATNCVR